MHAIVFTEQHYFEESIWGTLGTASGSIRIEVGETSMARKCDHLVVNGFQYANIQN